MHVFIFDFDMTLTVLQTESKIYDAEIRAKHAEAPSAERNRFIRKNMKPGIAGMFRHIWSKGHTVAIATFSANPPLVKEHLLAVGLNEAEIKSIIIEYRPFNYNELRFREENTGEKLINKNGQVSDIIGKVQAEHGDISGLTFVDDSTRNTQMLKMQCPEAEVIAVINHRGPDNLDPSCDFISAINEKLLNMPSHLEQLSENIAKLALQQADRLDHWYKPNGRKKATFIRNAVASNKAEIQALKASGDFDRKNVVRVYTQRETDGKTLPQALAYHRFFSLKSDREDAEALAQFNMQQRLF